MGGSGLAGSATGVRGGGPTGLAWGDEANGGRFESNLLPGGKFSDYEHSAPLGESVDVPEVAPVGESAGLVDVQGSTGEAAWRRRLSPRHRDAVREFFSHGKDE